MHNNIIHNKYYTTYCQLILKAKKRTNLTGYVEKHHILPRSMGGDDHISNLVRLTAKEHYVAHHLLFKCTKGQANILMSFAWFYMLRNRSDSTIKNRYFSARGYQQSKEAHAKALSHINKGRNVGSKSYKYNHTIYTFYHIPTSEYIKCTMHDLYTNYNIACSEVCRIMKNPKSSCKGFMWCPSEDHEPSPHDASGLNNTSADRHSYTFNHPDHGTFSGTRIELSEAYPNQKMTKAGMCDLIKGRTKSHRGWRLL